MTTLNFADLARLVTLETGRENVTSETRLDELGIDSLEFLTLLLAIENELGHKVPDEMVAQIHTIGDLANAVNPN